MGVCYTKAMLMQYGIAAEKLNPQLSEQEGYCGSLKWRNEENVKDTWSVLPAGTFRTADLRRSTPEKLCQPGVLGQRHYRAESWLDGQRLEQPYLFGRRVG
jgi:hypothetical protein